MEVSSKKEEFRVSYELALLYEKQGNDKAALQNAKRFLKILSSQPRPQLRQECVDIANVALECENYDVAAQALQQVLRIKPSDVDAHKLLASCYEHTGQIEKKTEQLILAKQFGGDFK